MPDADLTGLRVLLVGDAEPALVAATSETFQAAGCVVDRREAVDTTALGGLDVCVCFARPAAGQALAGADQGSWERALERALLGPIRLAMAAAREMAPASGGSIVIVGTLDASHAYPRRSVASVAMGGLLGLVRSMAVESAGQGIRANLVLAGPVGDADGRPPADADAELVDRTLLRSPLHRLGRPQEAAAAIRFVAGPDAAFMTGQTLRVDGGWASLNQAPEGMRFP